MGSNNIVDPNFIDTTVALAYITERFQRLGLRVPVVSTLRNWFNEGYISTFPHNHWKGWFTTVNWIDEAITWKRIPPRKGRPPLAQEVEYTREGKEYIATQEYLL